ncbi:hypothetical protein [Psychromonas sp. MB-3u-54]|uniref:hypothetical protein n=1 Tax=Psychromonas sp. MB-3u-54 TaxID=2058319 RepID=UPI0018E3DC05|nr:hypothetical protein [Psychromonas sp. MB-3u-54]
MNTQPLYIKNAPLILADNVLNNASLPIENRNISAINPKIACNWAVLNLHKSDYGIGVEVHR